MASEIVEEHAVSIVKACKIMNLDRSMFYYTSTKDDREVEDKLRWYAEHYPARGFSQYFKRIRKEGLIWNHKRVRRVYLKLGMNRRKKAKRRIANSQKEVLLQPLYPNLTWSVDFMEDKLVNGRRFRTLNIIDDYNREALNIAVDYSFPSAKVVEVIQQIIDWRGQPQAIRSDNGTEFVAKAFEGFCDKLGIHHIKSQKGKPMQNGYIERFNRTYREDVLDMHIFENIHQVKHITDIFTEDYNNNHPHDSLADMTPTEFLNHRSKKIPIFAVGF
jgi:putative transposase